MKLCLFLLFIFHILDIFYYFEWLWVSFEWVWVNKVAVAGLVCFFFEKIFYVDVYDTNYSM